MARIRHIIALLALTLLSLWGAVAHSADVHTLVGDQYNLPDAARDLVEPGEGSLGHVLTHAVVGCGAAELQGGDCNAGAVAGGISAIIAGQVKDSGATLEEAQEWADEVTLISGVGAALTGADSEAVQIAAGVGTSAFENNYLTHAQIDALAEDLENCRATQIDGGCQDIWDHYEQLSEQNRTDMLACLTAECWDIHRTAMNDGLTAINDLRGASFVQDQGIDILLGAGANFAQDQFLESHTLNSVNSSTALSGQSFESFGTAYCSGIYDSACMASFRQTLNAENLAQSAMIGVGTGVVVAGGMVIGPQIAAACMASPTCMAAYTAFEVGGNAADVAACAAGDPLSCSALAVNAVTPGNFADEIADAAVTTRAADDLADAVPSGIGDEVLDATNSCAGGRCGSAIDGIYGSTRPMADEFPELAGVNPHYVDGAGPGVNTNCVSCVNATVDRLTGRNPNAVSGQSNGYGSGTDLAPSAPWGFGPQTSPANVTNELLSQGDGAYAVVRIQQAGNVEHVIVGVNRGGTVHYVDPQLGSIVELQPNLIVRPGYP